MTDQELDRMMRRVLLDAVRLDEEREESEATPSFTPSSRHRRQTRAMLADPLGWSRRRERPAWRQALRRVAVLALACALAFGSVMAVSPTARAAVMRWVVELSGDGITYRYTGEQNTEPMPRYEITALPEGFAETERNEAPGLVSVVYQNRAGDMIGLDYAFMHQGGQANYILNEDECFEVAVNQLEGRFFRSRIPGNQNVLSWIDPDLNIHFNMDGCFELDDLLHMAESISLCETPN